MPCSGTHEREVLGAPGGGDDSAEVNPVAGTSLAGPHDIFDAARRTSEGIARRFLDAQEGHVRHEKVSADELIAVIETGTGRGLDANTCVHEVGRDRASRSRGDDVNPIRAGGDGMAIMCRILHRTAGVRTGVERSGRCLRERSTRSRPESTRSKLVVGGVGQGSMAEKAEAALMMTGCEFPRRT